MCPFWLLKALVRENALRELTKEQIANVIQLVSNSMIAVKIMSPLVSAAVEDVDQPWTSLLDANAMIPASAMEIAAKTLSTFAMRKQV